jgi:hypothetical protein
VAQLKEKLNELESQVEIFDPLEQQKTLIKYNIETKGS